jgi:glycine cleavage system H protein
MATEPFHGTIPADLHYDTRHDMWVRRDGDSVVIGATAFGIHLAGTVIAFTAKPKGAEIARERGIGTIESAKTVIAVHSPLSFVLDEPNESAEEKPQLINTDPYGDGWMAKGRALAWNEECPRLVDAHAYATHVHAMDPRAQVEVKR